MTSNKYCPVCGHQLTGTFNYGIRAKSLLNKRSDYTQIRIKLLFRMIQKEKSLTAFDMYKFLQRVKEVNDAKLRKVIEEFIINEHHKKLHGLPYLAGWVMKYDESYEKRKVIERKIIGGSPPTRRI